jgi:glycosyltransferase involved in cell wall biosynthesis
LSLFKEGRAARITDSTHFHFEYPNPALLPLWLAAKFFLRFEWVKILHDGSLPARYEGFGLIKRLLFRMAAKGIDEFIVYNRELEKWLRETAGFKRKIRFINILFPLPADWGKAEMDETLRIALDRFGRHEKRVSSVGIFIPSYGFAEVARAVETIRRETGEDIGLLLVDGGFQSDESLRSEILKGREDWIDVVSGVPHANLGRIFARSDVFVRAFAHESYGLSRVEALWSGVTVIATSAGETRGMLVYESGDAEALTNHLKAVLSGETRTDIDFWAGEYRREADRNVESYLRALAGETEAGEAARQEGALEYVER